jgi:hypothetical protein
MAGSTEKAAPKCRFVVNVLAELFWLFFHHRWACGPASTGNGGALGSRDRRTAHPECRAAHSRTLAWNITKVNALVRPVAVGNAVSVSDGSGERVGLFLGYRLSGRGIHSARPLATASTLGHSRMMASNGSVHGRPLGCPTRGVRGGGGD